MTLPAGLALSSDRVKALWPEMKSKLTFSLAVAICKCLKLVRFRSPSKEFLQLSRHYCLIVAAPPVTVTGSEQQQSLAGLD